MRWRGKLIHNFGFLVFCAVAVSSVAFASTNSCQTTSSTSVGVTDFQTGGVPIAAAGLASPNADDFATLNGAAVPGCSTIDMTFNNFTATLNTNGVPVNTNTGTYISTLANQNLATGNVSLIFSDVRGTDSDVDLTANDGTNGWVAVRKAAPAIVVTDYTVTSTDVVSYFSLNLLGVAIGGGTGGATSGTVKLCLGGTWSSGGTGGTCSGTTQTITLTTGVYSYGIALTIPSLVIGIQNSFTLSPGTSASGNTYLTSFDETFGETPEPSTFVLFGSALAGIAALRARKRKQS